MAEETPLRRVEPEVHAAALKTRLALKAEDHKKSKPASGVASLRRGCTR